MRSLICFSFARERLSDRVFLTALIQRLHEFNIEKEAILWWDERVQSGELWHSEIQSTFAAADFYVVLASKGYVSNQYILDFEWPLIETRSKSGEAKLFWLPIDQKPEEFCGRVNLARFQAAGGLRSPLIQVTPNERSEYMRSIATELALCVSTSSSSDSVIVQTDSPQNATKLSQSYSPRQIEADYLSALRAQCDAFPQADRYLPMQRLYVRLRADERPTGELLASQNLLDEEICDDLQKRPRLSPEEVIARHVNLIKPRPSRSPEMLRHFDDDSLENIFQQNRFLVVKGGPGSGKTVLCWRLCSCLADGWRQEFTSGTPHRGRRLTEVGPARLPILVSIRDYARALLKPGKPLPLAAFLGHHISKDRDEGERFHTFLIGALERNEAVVLLDGLDEVPVMRRHEVVFRIQEFLASHVINALASEAPPSLEGGNQLLVTSRIAGYEIAPITDNRFRLFEVRPFDEEAIEAYCRHWANIRYASHRRIIGAISDELVRCVFTDASPAVRELAQTPVLLQVLCELATPIASTTQGARNEMPQRLPRHRAEIYQKAIECMAQRWQAAYGLFSEQDEHLSQLLLPGRIETLLSLVAFEMLQEEIIRSTTETRLREWLEIGICHLTQKPAYELLPATVTGITETLLELLRTHVGVISEKAPSVFEFHHLTFQEYLAGRALCFDFDRCQWLTAEQIAEHIAERVRDPRWREVALLAFGQLGIQMPARPEGHDPLVILELIRKYWASSKCPPNEAELLAMMLLEELPDETLVKAEYAILCDLVTAYSRWGGGEHFDVVRRPFAEAIARLRRRAAKSNRLEPFDRSLILVLHQELQLSAPLANILLERCWLTDSLLHALSEICEQDQAEWNWPIHRSLRMAITGKDWEPKVLNHLDMPADGSNDVRLARHYASALIAWERYRQVEQERCLGKLQNAPLVRNLLSSSGMSHERRRVVIALCGGFQDVQVARWSKEYQEIARLLSYSDGLRSHLIDQDPDYYITRWGVNDTIYNMAVYLDTRQGGRTDLAKQAPVLAADFIFYDPSPQVLNVLSGCDDGAVCHDDLKDRLYMLLKARCDTRSIAEAYVGLMAIGHVTTYDLLNEDRHRIEWHVKRMLNSLHDPVARFVTRSTRTKAAQESDDTAGGEAESLWNVLDRLLPTLPDDESAAVFRLAMKTVVRACNMPVTPKMKAVCLPTSQLGMQIEADKWARAFANVSDDSRYDFAVLLDHSRFSDVPSILLKQLWIIADAANFGFARSQLAAHLDISRSTDVLEHVSQLLQGLCFSADQIDVTFGGAFFEKATSGIFRHEKYITPRLLEIAARLGIGVGSLASPLPRPLRLDRLPSPPPTPPGCVDLELNPNSPPFRNDDLDVALRLCRNDSISESDGWKAFTIAAAGGSLLDALGQTVNVDHLWRELRNGPKNGDLRSRDAFDSILLHREAKGLTLTQEAIDTIEHYASIGDVDSIRRVIPLFDHLPASSVRHLVPWAEGTFAASVSDACKSLLAGHAALLLAESSSDLQEKWIEPLLGMIHNGDDVSACRARLVLGGSVLDVRRGTRRRRLSVIGHAPLVRLLDAAPRVNREFLSDWHIDSLPHLQEVITTDREDTRITRLFACAATWSPDCLEWLVEWLSAKPKESFETYLLDFACLLSYQDEIPASLVAFFAKHTAEHCPRLLLLSEEASYSVIVSACRGAAASEYRDAEDIVTRIDEAIHEACHTSFVSADEDLEAWKKQLASLGNSSMQLLVSSPEDCWKAVEPHLYDERFFEVCLFYLNAALAQKENAHREKAIQMVFLTRVTTAILSVMSVLTEVWRDKFASVLKHDDGLRLRLKDRLRVCAIEDRMTRARMAAITLLSRVAELDGSDITEVYKAAMRDCELVRQRALSVLPHFRNVTITEEFLEYSLNLLAGVYPASHTLAIARMMSTLLSENMLVRPEQRLRVLQAIRLSAYLPQHKRVIAHLSGAGEVSRPRSLAIEGRLDHYLIALSVQRRHLGEVM